KLLNDLKVRPAAPDVAYDEKTAQALFAFLVEPMLPWIKTEHLVILPHGVLNEIPFEVLLDPTDRRFLGDRFRITYAPSATILLGLKEPKPLSVGQMLVVSARSIDLGESDAIARLFPARCQVEKNLGVAKLKGLVPRYDFVHVSAHGVFDLAEP